MVRVSKTAESEVAATSSNDNDLQNYARVARRQVGKSIAGLQVLSVDKSTKANGALVNLTIQIDHRGNSNNVQDELVKKLQPLGQVEKIVDFDECSSSLHNDCSPRARCINEPGSYNCQCLESYIDLDQTLPGRLCVSEVKSCDYCHGRGDCWRNQSDTVCRCHPMFIGRRCEINGLCEYIMAFQANVRRCEDQKIKICIITPHSAGNTSSNRRHLSDRGHYCFPLLLTQIASQKSTI